jgi:hypothetical protein
LCKINKRSNTNRATNVGVGILSDLWDLTRVGRSIGVESWDVPYPSHLDRVVFSQLWDVDADQLPLDRARAITIPAVAAARLKICATIARLPLRSWRDDDLVDPQPRWISRTDRDVSPFHRMLWTVDDILFYGWSLWIADRDADGQVIAATRIPKYRWTFSTDELVEIDGQPVPATIARDLILIPGPHEGILTFGSPTLRHAANLTRAADRTAETPTPNLELHQTTDRPMAPDDIKALIGGWAAARRGRNGGVAYTNSAIEAREHGAPAEHLLVEGRNVAAIDIARICGVPASMIDAYSGYSLTYQTVEGRNRELVEYGLAPYMAAISARLGMDDVVPRGQRVVFDLEDYLAATVGGLGTQDDDTTGTSSTATTPAVGPPAPAGGQ